MARLPSPINHNVSIVHENGTPTQEFMRWLTDQLGTNKLLPPVEEQVALNVEAIAALILRKILTTSPLSGGGDLSADRTLTLLDTAVTAGTYGDATNSPQITIDAKGRITAAADVPISGGGGGGGSVLAFPPYMNTSFSGGAQASKGSIITPYKDITVTEIVCRINATSTHSYKGGLYALNASNVIQSVLAESAVISPAASGAQMMKFPVTSAVALSGTRYYFGVTRTDGTTTFSLPVGGVTNANDENNFANIPVEPYPLGGSTASPFARITSISPAIGQTVGTGGPAGFGVGLIGSF